MILILLMRNRNLRLKTLEDLVTPGAQGSEENFTDFLALKDGFKYVVGHTGRVVKVKSAAALINKPVSLT